jgi:hypothetical protein
VVSRSDVEAQLSFEKSNEWLPNLVFIEQHYSSGLPWSITLFYLVLLLKEA